MGNLKARSIYGNLADYLSLLFIYLMGWLRFPHEVKVFKLNKFQYFFAFLVLLFSIYLIQGLGKNQTGQLALLSGFPPLHFTALRFGF